MIKKRTTGLMSLAFIIVLASIFVANQVDNDTWDETHWGGDTGEEEYSTSPTDEITEGGGGICGSIIIFGVISILVIGIKL
ncbi:hypothetical protein KAU43_05875 [candidate division WOR-3 bacterium]|nr:hypothetical protein [candidate division WOR-3 bacterium]